MKRNANIIKWESLWVLVAWIALAAIASPAVAQDDWDDDWDDDASAIEIHGFVEGSGAGRLQNDPTISDDFVLGEARFRLDLSHFTDRAEFSFKGDLVSDAITSESLIDIRRAWLKIRASHWLDIRAGRQILTWGTGDLLFLNDLFPKDFQSFFVGRDVEFLKAPSNSFKLSAYSRVINADLVWTPVFTPDVYITGERLSFYSPLAGGIVSSETMGAPFEAPTPDQTWKNGEVAARLHRVAGSFELAAYGYWGFFKQPLGYDAGDSTAVFPRLAVGGASGRGNLLGGVFNVEGAYYLSRDDRDGDNPYIPNSQLRGLAGYERELFSNFTLGAQYFVEHILDYDCQLIASFQPSAEPRETRQMVTARLTQRLMQQTLTLSLFGFVALEDGDTHWRPQATRQWTDAVAVSLGANVMTGDDDTFFGQLENNSNVYLRLRYSF